MRTGWYLVYPDGELEFLSRWRWLARLRFNLFVLNCADKYFTSKCVLRLFQESA